MDWLCRPETIETVDFFLPLIQSCTAIFARFWCNPRPEGTAGAAEGNSNEWNACFPLRMYDEAMTLGYQNNEQLLVVDNLTTICFVIFYIGKN